MEIVPTITFKPIGYIDSIYVRSPEALNISLMQRVKSYVRNGYIGGLHFGKPRGQYRAEVLVGFHQPSQDFMRILDDLVGCEGWQLFEVHVASDLLTNSQSEADTLAKYLAERLVQRHRPKSKRVKEYARTTTYFCEQTAPRNIALYADRLSKYANSWACHIEVRIRRAGTLRRLGITRVSDILTCDFGHVFRKIMALEEPDIRKLGRSAIGRGHAKKPWIYRRGSFQYDHDLRTGQTILRHFQALASDEPLSHPPLATLVRAACGHYGIRPESVLKRIDLGPFLPPAFDNNVILTSSSAHVANTYHQKCSQTPPFATDPIKKDAEGP